MNPLNRTSLAVVASVVAIASASADTVYYVAPGADIFYKSTAGTEYGNQVTFPSNSSGGPWTIQSLTVPYYSNYGLNGGLTLKIYSNDGTGGAPGTQLWSSGPLDILSGGGSVTVPFPYSADNKVPNSLTYTVSFNGASVAGNQAGLYLPGSNPAVGSAQGIWSGNSGIWEKRALEGGGIPVFQATITAVPEPSTWALAGLGLVGLIAAASRSRKA